MRVKIPIDLGVLPSVEDHRNRFVWLRTSWQLQVGQRRGRPRHSLPTPGKACVIARPMERELSAILGRKVDLVSRRAIERSLNWIRRKAILEGAEPYYAAR